MSERLVGRDPETGKGVAVAFEGGRITAIAAADYDGPLYLGPGLVDLQVNGYAQYDLNDGTVTPERVLALTELMLAHGTTTYLPTLVTASEANITAGLVAIREARTRYPLVARAVPFVHVEGPFISIHDGPRGAHPAAHVRDADIAEFERWQAASGGLVGLLTLSPHSDAAIALVRHATGQGVHVAIGHTDATPEQIHAAAAAGARLSTHLGNGASAMLPRHPNVIWAQLADDRLTATLIGDSHHLPADTLKAMLRAKGLDQALLVSDVVSPGGLKPGIYHQTIGGRVELQANGRLGPPGTPYLAGAALPLADDVARTIGATGLSLSEVLGLATRNPGRFAGGRGRLEAGAAADLIQFEWSPGAERLAIAATYLAGERVWAR
ncbi:MAG TPA: amidohydrolase family protein [Devosia sp.]|uniref:N-acetylglucosamine-6-phosphate deacetylase n=1 Tax=Devosia sp. TaxID=1871048 RepID=UPI002DDD52BD|nr:amidohydrolase family protein [Devosia sp.]HEV2518418.1 amidohydrolase family protein [Devosia sp.]